MSSRLMQQMRAALVSERNAPNELFSLALPCSPLRKDVRVLKRAVQSFLFPLRFLLKLSACLASLSSQKRVPGSSPF